MKINQTLFKKFILCGVFGSCFYSSLANAAAAVPGGGVPTPGPMVIGDSIRGITGSVVGLLKVGEMPETGADINVYQGWASALQEGENRLEELGKGEFTDATAIPTPAFDLVNKKVLDPAKSSGFGTPYKPLNDKIKKKGADIEKVVKEMFFTDGTTAGTQKTVEELEAEAQRRRQEYLITIGKEYTRLAYGVHEALTDEMTAAISTPVYANGSNGAISGADVTWKAINRALIADIAMQIQLMELDAAKFLAVQPIELMPDKEKGSENGEGGKA